MSLKKSQILYNKSKKRVKVEGLNRLDKDSPILLPKKIDLRTVISSLSKEIERTRKAKKTKKTHKSN